MGVAGPAAGGLWWPAAKRTRGTRHVFHVFHHKRAAGAAMKNHIMFNV